jgi:hypothetical protein
MLCRRGNRAPERADWSQPSAGWTKRIDGQIALLDRIAPPVTASGWLTVTVPPAYF